MRAVCSAAVKVRAGVGVVSTPDDHVATGPHPLVIESANGRACCAGGYPTVGASIVSPAGVKINRRAAKKPAPNYHFSPGPDRHVRVPCGWRVGGVDRRPTIVGRVVSASRIAIVERRIRTAPHHHFAAAPYCCVTDPSERRVSSAGSCPAIVSRIISAAGV